MSNRSKMLILAQLSALTMMSGGIHRTHDWNPLEHPPEQHNMKCFNVKRTKKKKRKPKYRRKRR